VSGNVNPDPTVVHDEASFLAFVADLVEDRRLANEMDGGPTDAPRGWQNDTIEHFLESAVRWAQDSNFGRSQGLTENVNAWMRLAVFLYCGKIYE